MTKNKSGKRKEIPKPIREEWTDDVIQDLKDYCNKIAQVIYPDVTSPLLAMDDIAARYLESFVPINPLGDKRALSLCLLSYPPYSLEVGDDLSHLKAILYCSNSEFRISLPINSKSPSTLLDVILSRYEDGGIGHGSDALNKQLHVLDDIAMMLTGADVGYSPDAKERFEKSLNNLVVLRKNKLNRGLEYLSEKGLNDLISTRKKKLNQEGGKFSENSHRIQLELINSVEFNEAFDAWASSSVIKIDDVTQKILKYRFMLLICIVFLRIYQHKNDKDCLISCVAINEVRNRTNSSESIKSQFLQEMLRNKTHSTQPNAKELKAIKEKSKELLSLLVGRTDDISTLFQLYKLSNASKADFSVTGLISGQGSNDSGYHARVFVKTLASFLIYHEFDYLLFCQLAGDKYYRFSVKNLKERCIAIITSLVDIFFDNTSKDFVKPNTEQVIKQIEKDIKPIASVMGQSIPLGASNAGDALNYSVDMMIRGCGFEPEAVKGFVNRLDQTQAVESQCDSIRQRVAEHKGVSFWDDLYGYTGSVNDLVACSELKKIEFPDFSDPLWVDMVELARSSIPYLKSVIKNKVL